MADFKALHDKWKSAKKNAKMAWEMLDKQTGGFSASGMIVKFNVIRFPKFDKDLGPSLDKLYDLEKKRKDVKDKDRATLLKDVAKYKGVADTALKQYENDIKALVSNRGTVQTPAVNEKKTNEEAVKRFGQVLKLVDQELTVLENVRKEINVAVQAVKTT